MHMADGAEISLKENGPILVSGEFTLSDEQGNPIPDLNPTIALCRCGLSANKPFCDGSHSSQGWTSN
jgi:CDGSH-type Zn-finger protein